MTPGHRWAISTKEYWTATGVIPRWQQLLIYVLIVVTGAIGISKSSGTAHQASGAAHQASGAVRQIQEQRIALCEDQNHRHDSTIAELRALSAQQSKKPQSIILNIGNGPQHATIVVSRQQNVQGTIALINALVPKHNCHKFKLIPVPPISNIR